MILEFTINCNPTAQQRSRSTSIGNWHYKTSSQEVNETELIMLLKKHRPPEPIKTAVCLEFIAFVPIPKKTSKKNRLLMQENKIKRIKKPDLDNYAKQIKDCLTYAGFWTDDNLVYKIIAEKRYDDGNGSRWHVKIKY